MRTKTRFARRSRKNVRFDASPVGKAPSLALDQVERHRIALLRALDGARAERDEARGHLADLLPERDAFSLMLTQVGRERGEALAALQGLREAAQGVCDTLGTGVGSNAIEKVGVLGAALAATTADLGASVIAEAEERGAEWFRVYVRAIATYDGTSFTADTGSLDLASEVCARGRERAAGGRGR